LGLAQAGHATSDGRQTAEKGFFVNQQNGTAAQLRRQIDEALARIDQKNERSDQAHTPTSSEEDVETAPRDETRRGTRPA
jgi:hypothetical protein